MCSLCNGDSPRCARAAAGVDAAAPPGEPASNLHALHALHGDLPPAERFRRVAIDVFHFHLASQANLYAGALRRGRLPAAAGERNRPS